MDIIQTTNNLYRLTLFFPKKEPLRYKMREVASDILIMSNNGKQRAVRDLLLDNLKTLNDFFEIVKEQHWVSHSDILVVQTAYLNLLKELKTIAGSDSTIAEISISERQKKILDFIKEKGNIQVRQVQQFFPQLSKRTLRRDFEQMFHYGLIKRIGEKSSTSYQIKNN